MLSASAFFSAGFIDVLDVLLEAHGVLQLLQLLFGSRYLLGESHSFLNFGCHTGKGPLQN